MCLNNTEGEVAGEKPIIKMYILTCEHYGCDSVRSPQIYYWFSKCCLQGKIVTMENRDPGPHGFLTWIQFCFLGLCPHSSWLCPPGPCGKHFILPLRLSISEVWGVSLSPHILLTPRSCLLWTDISWHNSSPQPSTFGAYRFIFISLRDFTRTSLCPSVG